MQVRSGKGKKGQTTASLVFCAGRTEAMAKKREIETLDVSCDESAKSPAQAVARDGADVSEHQILTTLKASLANFEREHPDIVAELNVLGFDIDEYEASLAISVPQIRAATNSTLNHDME